MSSRNVAIWWAVPVARCGLENADTFFETLPRLAETPTVIPQIVLKRALDAFNDHQPLNRETHTVHGTAWVDLDGAILLAREDVVVQEELGRNRSQ